MKLFLTGISGTAGSWIAAQALRRRWQVVALMRDPSRHLARARLDRALDIAQAPMRANEVEIVQGDLCRKKLGLDVSSKALRDVSLICHCAASTNFDRQAAELVHQTNVEGTARVLDLASRWQVGLVYVSTAYICGKRMGLVLEDQIDVGQSFNNVYEQSKYQAELLVSRWARQNDLPSMVLRPSIILGDSRFGHTVHFDTVYNQLRFFDSLSDRATDRKIRVLAQAEATKNMIPVDYFARAACEIIDRGKCGTYHLTNPAPITLGQLRDIFGQLFRREHIQLVGEKDFQHCKPNRAERMLRDISRYYLPYMESEPNFDRQNTDTALSGSGIQVPSMGLDYFQRLLAYARSVNWAQEKRGPKLVHNVPSSFDKYFGEFLVRWTGRPLLENVRKLTATFRIMPKETEQTHWTVQIQQGILTNISRNGNSYQCSFIIESQAFDEVVAGKLVPQRAFFDRRVEIKGDIEMGLKLIAVMAAFFKKFPFERKSN